MNKKQKRNKKWIWLGKVFLVAAVVFSFHSAQASFDSEWYLWDEDEFEIVEADQTWTKAENKVVRKGILIRNNATLTVEKGATVKFAREAEDFAPVIIVENGKIVADGTEKDPIFFTSDQDDSGFSFYFNNSHGQESFFRYVTIEKAGGEYEIWSDAVQAWWEGWNFFGKSVQAGTISHGRSYPVHYYQGKVHFENCVFNNPNSEIEIKMEDLMLTVGNIENNSFQVVNSNFEAVRNQLVLASNMDCEYTGDWDFLDVCWNRTLFKNNWYGREQGWVENYDSYFWRYLAEKDLREGDQLCNGECLNKSKSLAGLFVNVDGYKKNVYLYDPVVIIPGITGSEIDPETNRWVLDPILHTYDDLYSSFKTVGFEEGKDLFAFPYQWRQKNELSAVQLKEKIEEIKTATGFRKVDLVAHSMGGLLARYYLQSDGTNAWNLNYENDVDQLITLGTPHRGSPSAYLQWEAGEGHFTFFDYIAKYHFQNEAKHNGYSNIFDYIQNEILSVQQLLPDNANYLSGINGFQFGYPENEFLQKLNQTEKWEDLTEKVRVLKIAGYQEEDDETITELKLTASSKTGLWKDGMPENYYGNQSGLVYGAGDGTVPLSSARGLTGGEGKTLDIKHNKLPKEAQCEVLEALGADKCDKQDGWSFPNLLYFNLFSPADLQVVDPDGKRVGKDFETGELLNEIEGAFYSGFATENEFLTIPVEENEMGKYQVLLSGTDEEEDDREYTLEVNLMTENSEEETLTFSDEIGWEEDQELNLKIENEELKKADFVTAGEIENNLKEAWEKRRMHKKAWLLLRNELRSLTKKENIKKDAPRRAEFCVTSKPYYIWIRKENFLQQLRKVRKIVKKNRRIFENTYFEILTTQLAELEKAEK